MNKTRSIDGVDVPAFFYGTAWKEDDTARLTRLALEQGFRAIDTANQRKHYHEAGVGAALSAAFEDGIVTREQLFVQTKFTYQRGQDHRLPYDPDASFTEQVQQSFASSLEHLGLDRIDSLVLHGPYDGAALGEEDHEVWEAMEALQRAGHVRFLGVSNVGLQHLRPLFEQVAIKPTFVQNRCYASKAWDADIRALCARHDAWYQGFSLLTANREALQAPAFVALMERTGLTRAQLVFGAALQWHMIPLTGTSSAAHMAEDLAAFDVKLSAEDLKIVAG